MLKRFRFIFIVAVVLVIAAIGFRALSGGPAGSSGGTTTTSAKSTDTTTAERGDVALTVSATAPLQAKQKVAISFSTSGTVGNILVKPSDHVLKGQTLAVLNTQTLTDSLLSAQATLLAKQVALRKITEKPCAVDLQVYETNLDYAKAQLYEAQHSGQDPIETKIKGMNLESAKNNLWQTELQRDADDKKRKDLEDDPRTWSQAASVTSTNQNNSNISSKDFDVKVAQANYDAQRTTPANLSSVGSAQASIVAAQNDLNDALSGGNKDDIAKAEANIRAAQAAVDLAKENLAKATLVAPFDGVVAKINITNGELTNSGDNAIVMLDTSSLYEDISIDERDIAKITVGQPVAVTFDALPGVSVNGKVTRIADAGSKSGSVVTYSVRVEIDPAGQPLISSMSGTASIATSQVQNVVRLRNRFIRLDRATNKAYANLLQANGAYKEVEVTLGLRSDTYTEIKSGLQLGDKVGLVATANLPPAPGN